MTLACDLIRDAQDLDGRRLLDEDMERRILDDLIVTGCTDMEHWDSLSNKGTAVFVLRRAVQGYLLNGASLECGDLQITLPEPNTTLKVRSVADRTFHLAEPLSSPLPARGAYLLAGEAPRTGFEVESAAGDAITVRDYPAIACDEVTVLNSGWVRIEP